ncbi:copper amine oxidase N-terminal domain-containing protein [Heliorestis acidaminivorans]|uniref:Copper amine oxidase N-terminal domain-containing protein n=1 Tax=Heliorestis acidaminivorans TaxID=553427 RepID=A0A6I0F2R3_9FIRM|nr:copper amine oxidase N-terminal domain-containing protein [Heliorestis acidaminivorans]KAB2954271.1 copper amine oxidase N-terminal domain-containing protein [Heliorestis acidaminivorans]
MISNKLIAGTIATALAVTLITTPSIAGANYVLKENRTVQADTEREVSAIGTFTGKVKEIDDFHVEGSIKILLENDQDREAHLIISPNTYVAGKENIEVGDIVTGYYDRNMPIIMIYPPQYPTELIVVDTLESNFKVDFFDANLLSEDQELSINITDETEILLPNGTSYKGKLTDKALAVFYDISTDSIPALTTPTKVIVLFEKELPPSEDTIVIDFSNVEYMINNQEIITASPYADEKGTLMVPLRSITEALGFSLTWDEKEQSIVIGNDIYLQIGKDSYTNVTGVSKQLGTAPVLTDGTTYVPLHFFRDIVPMNNAYFFEGQIVINNDEPQR